jgi:hypothetical protein
MLLKRRKDAPQIEISPDGTDLPVSLPKFTAVAHADPITLTQDFKALTAVATISGGAVLVSSQGVETLMAQNANWTLLVNVKLVNDANLGDMISIDGTMQHLNDMPDDGKHQHTAVFMFTVTIKPEDKVFNPMSFAIDHLPHIDQYVISADIKRTGNQIDSWKIEIKVSMSFLNRPPCSYSAQD